MMRGMTKVRNWVAFVMIASTEWFHQSPRVLLCFIQDETLQCCSMKEGQKPQTEGSNIQHCFTTWSGRLNPENAWTCSYFA